MFTTIPAILPIGKQPRINDDILQVKYDQPYFEEN